MGDLAKTKDPKEVAISQFMGKSPHELTSHTKELKEKLQIAKRRKL